MKPHIGYNSVGKRKRGIVATAELRPVLNHTQELFLGLLRRCFPHSNSRERPDAPEDDAWPELARFIDAQLVGPFLFSRLKASRTLSTLPPAFAEKLTNQYYALLKANVRAFAELEIVVQSLAEAGIRVILLKGGHLARFVYGNIALRPMCDFDLLAGKGELHAAEEVLRRVGYQPADGIGRLPKSVELGMSRELPQLCKPNARPIELHWTLMDPITPFRIDVEGLWRRSRPVRIGKAEAFVLDPEDLLLYLSLHGAYLHRFSVGLLSLTDIAESVRRHGDEIRWETVVGRAAEWRCGKHVYISLRLARDLLGANIPAATLDRLEPQDFDQGLVRQAMEQVMRIDRGEPSDVSPNLALLWGSKPLKKKLRLYWKRIFPARADMAKIYSLPARAPRLLLCYPVRLKHLFLRYGVKNTFRMYALSSLRMLTQKERRKRLAGRETELSEWLNSN
jgi:hypothetical protein